MAKQLNTFVHVHNSKGDTQVFGPGDTVPAWAQKAITNPNVWVKDDDDAGSGDDSKSDEEDDSK